MKILLKPFIEIGFFIEKIFMRLYKIYLYSTFKKKMPNTIKKYKNLKDTDDHKINNCIWVFWYQKLENAPQIVKICIDSIKKNANANKIVILTKENIKDYIDMPKHVNEKFEKGLISIAHYSDVLRTMLLSKYGGMWIDATIYVSKTIPNECFQLDYYSLHSNKRLFEEITRGKWATFLQASKSNNFLICYCRDMLIEYWKNSNKIFNYLLYDFVISYGYEHYQIIKQYIDSIPENISDYKYCHVLRKTFSKKYNKEKYNHVLDKSLFSKLTYKIKFKLRYKNSITNYQHFLDSNKKI